MCHQPLPPPLSLSSAKLMIMALEEYGGFKMFDLDDFVRMFDDIMVKENIDISSAKEKEKVPKEDVKMDEYHDIGHSGTKEALQWSLAKEPFSVVMELNDRSKENNDNLIYPYTIKDSVFLYSMCCLNEEAFTNRLQKQPLHLPIIEVASRDVSNESWSVDVLLEKLGCDGILVCQWEMDFEKGGYGVEIAHKDFADTKNEEVGGKKSIKEGYQKECVKLGSVTTKNVEESEDKKSVKKDKQMEYAESGSDIQKIVKDLRIRSLIKLTSRWNVLTQEVVHRKFFEEAASSISNTNNI
nr:hypothetical protein [Tanacetum cinerariifolium]